MKDPLQVQPTPYEILGVDRSAGPADIDRAFKAGLEGVNPARITRAKKILERPVDRALVDMFQYDPRVLARLRPDPGTDPACLELSARTGTAEMWERQLRGSFPDYGVAHALAVLWYWWALDASERLAAVGALVGAGSTPFHTLWEGAVAYWAMVRSSDDFWSSQTVVPQGIVAEVRHVLSERLTGDLQRFAQHHRNTGQQELADQYRRLELMLATEVKTATALGGAGYRTSSGPLWCGALMLGRLALLDSIREQVGADLAAHPADATLQSLSRALSPHFRIAALIERKEPQAALDAIAALPEGTRRTKDVEELKARAMFLKGRQEESVGQIRAALEHWKEGAACAPPGEVADRIWEAASKAALAAATALHSRDREEAISILELAVSYAPTEMQHRTLAELLTDRGIQTVMKAQKDSEENPSAEEATKRTEAIEKGLADLDRGAELGSARAREQARAARELLKHHALPLPPQVQTLAQQAGEAASRGNLDISIRLLRSALGLVASDSQARGEVSRLLSAALSGHAVSLANSAIPELERASPKVVARRRDLTSRLQEALKELTEACQLDPTNEHAQANTRSILDIMERLGVPIPGAEARTSGRRAAVSRRAKRGGLHASLLGVGYVVAALLGVGALPLKAFGDPDRLSGWVRAVAHASPVSPVLLGLAYAFAVLGLLVVLSIVKINTYRPVIVELCTTRWSKRHNAARLIELGLYAFLLMFAASAFVYRRPAGPVEAPAVQIPAAVKVEPRPDAAASEVPNPETRAFDLADLTWLRTEPVPVETVTALLRSTADLSEEARAAALARFDSAGAGAGKSARAVLTLLHSAAAEERGDAGAARTGYHQLLTVGGGGPYAGTASLRLEVLEARDRAALESALLARAEESGDMIWARTGGGWVQATARRAALLGLMDLRAHRLTVRFFRFLARHAHTSPPASYLRIFCYILILWAVVQSPLFLKMNRLAKAAPALRPEVTRLQQQYRGDRPTLLKKLQEAYARHGVNPAWGCLHSLIDLAVVAVFFLTFRAYAPQLMLDVARFYWTADLLDRDLGVLALWGGIGLLRLASLPNVAGDSIRVTVSRALLGTAMVGVLAWLTRWPAWILIFWLTLWLWSLCIHALISWLPGRRA